MIDDTFMSSVAARITTLGMFSFGLSGTEEQLYLGEIRNPGRRGCRSYCQRSGVLCSAYFFCIHGPINDQINDNSYERTGGATAGYQYACVVNWVIPKIDFGHLLARRSGERKRKAEVSYCNKR